MWICHEPPFRFVHPPRTGGTSLVAALQQAFPVAPWPPEEVYHIADHGSLSPPEAADYPTLCTCRNPYQRELSLYLWCRVAGNNYLASQTELPSQAHPLAAMTMDFGTYVRWRWDHRQEGQGERLSGIQTRATWGIRIDRWIRFERLEEHYRSLPIWGDREPVPLEHHMGLAYDWREHYTAGVADLVATYAAADFVRLGYSFDLNEAFSCN